MKVIITASGPTLAEPIDLHFGRAKHFILADTATGDAQAHDHAHDALEDAHRHAHTA